MMDARTTRLLRKLAAVSPLNFEADEVAEHEIDVYPTNWGHRLLTDCAACRMAEYVEQAATDTRIRVQWLRSENRIHGFRVMR